MREEEAELSLSTSSSPLKAKEKININTAARDELMRLPGIGEVLANRIIERRPFEKIDAIGEVEGIGRKKLEDIRPNLKVKH